MQNGKKEESPAPLVQSERREKRLKAMKKKIAAAITYFEDAVRESDEIINDPEVTCSEDLMHDLQEQNKR